MVQSHGMGCTLESRMECGSVVFPTCNFDWQRMACYHNKACAPWLGKQSLAAEAWLYCLSVDASAFNDLLCGLLRM